ncbi:asialoglycoprotein receptor 1-like isoform X2 [Scomber scombrus]|uniref:Asialoglycoprotein receptor 1-like isoform X2 n=1 Tax=Scomber scombrus TaxID=13677 RepID=A0AAV1N315_SCOSC
MRKYPANPLTHPQGTWTLEKINISNQRIKNLHCFLSCSVGCELNNLSLHFLTATSTTIRATRRMQEIEMADYVNQQPRNGQELSGDTNQSAERRLCRLLLLSFGLLCIIQATLNISLRLTLHSSNESTLAECNTTQLVQKVQTSCDTHCNELQERFNALTRDRDQLQNRISQLNNDLKDVTEERDRLRIQMRVLQLRTVSVLQDGERSTPDVYFLSSESKTWEDSRKYCQSESADLVVINSEQEQKALYRLDGDVDLLFWIGLYDTAGTFKWVDGSALTKPTTFWQVGQPDRGGPNNREDCVEMYHFNPVLASWNDAPCGHKRRWLCERDPCTDS